MLQRKVHTDIRVLHHSVASMRGMDGISDVTLASLQGQVTSLHAAVEQLMVIKEMRTPMVSRAL